MAKDKLLEQLKKDAQVSWDALQQFRSTWDDKERALLAQVNDSFSGNITRARVTDAELSTLAFERQARVAAQLPSGKVYGASKKEEGKAKLANIILNRYIVPNGDSQFDMLIKQRMWGVYASVYGSMPMFYDYRVDDKYIGPDCWLVDPRSFLPQPGHNNIQDMDWCMISTIVSVGYLKSIAKKKNTSWNKTAVQLLIKLAEEGRPARDDDAEKESVVSRTRYTKEQAKGRIEIITKYESGEDGHWITFAPDYDVPVLRDIPNPHKSGRIPVVMRHCFPLMNSIFGLGDFERGMKIQKSKDSLLGLRLEFVKNRVFPPIMVNKANVTPSTIRNQANSIWSVTDMNSVKPVTYGGESMNEFQSTYSLLDGILQNQFGSTTTQLNSDQSSNPSFGRTPQALKMQESRENARDTWDRFMHEKATEELYEGMLNLLCVKMEKPINFTIFEEEIRQISNEYPDVLEMIGDKYGAVTIAKKDLKSDKPYKFVIDANSSMRQDDEAQLEALIQLYQILSQDPTLEQKLAEGGLAWDKAEHIKKIFLSSGIQDPEMIIKEGAETSMEQSSDAMPEGMEQPQQDLSQHPIFQDPELDPQIAQFAQQVIGNPNVGGLNG